MSAVPVNEAPQLWGLMSALSTARVLEATAALGLLHQLSAGPKDASELAQACATDPTMTALLVDTLADLGVVHRNSPRGYTAGPNGLALIRMASHAPDGSQLANAIRSGKPFARADTVEGAEMCNLAAKGEPDNGDAIGIDLGMAGECLQYGIGFRNGRRPHAHDSALAQPGCRDAVVGHGGKSGFAELLGMPAFVHLRVATERVYDHNDRIAILDLVGESERRREVHRTGWRLTCEKLAEIAVLAGFDGHRLGFGRCRC